MAAAAAAAAAAAGAASRGRPGCASPGQQRRWRRPRRWFRMRPGGALFALLASLLLLLLLRLLWCWTDAPARSRYPLAHRTPAAPRASHPGTLVAPPLLSGAQTLAGCEESTGSGGLGVGWDEGVREAAQDEWEVSQGRP